LQTLKLSTKTPQPLQIGSPFFKNYFTPTRLLQVETELKRSKKEQNKGIKQNNSVMIPSSSGAETNAWQQLC